MIAPRRALTVGVALAGLAAASLAAPPAARAAGESSVEIPPVEVVRALRSARHSHTRGEEAAELAELRRAAEAFPDEITVTHALLEYDRCHGLPEGEHRALEERMRRRLADLDHPLAIGVLRQMASEPEASGDLLGDLVRHVEAHLGGPAGTEDDAPDLLRLLVALHLRLGHDAEAAAALASLWHRTERTDVAWELVSLRHRLGDAEGALEVMEKVPEIRETLASDYVLLLADSGRLEEARAAAETRLAKLDEAAGEGAEAFGERPIDFAPLLEDLAWSFRDVDRDREAEALFRRALALDPDHPGLQATVLHLYASDEERAEAVHTVESSWRDQTDPQALLDEGTKRLAAGDAAGAFDLLDRAAPSFPDLEAAWYNLGMAACRLERWERAAEALTRAGELNPERAANPFFAGIALSHLERCAEAVPQLERALALDPSRNQAHYFLAGCLRALGRPADAERHRALFDPG